MSVRLLTLLFATIAAPALAQDQAIQREVMRRQQQSDAFVQQLQQSQQLLQVPAGDAQRRRDLEIRQFSDRQRLEQTSEQQLRDVRPDYPPELRPYERLKVDEERRPLIIVPTQ